MLNPYKNVVWSINQQVKSLSHTHINTQGRFNKAVELGYEHIPATDYQPSKPRYPLSQYFSSIPSGVIGSPNSEKVNTTDSYHYNALGSFAEGHGHGVETDKIDYQTLFDEIFAGLQYPDGGGVTINHPVSRNLSQCCERLDYDDRVLGIEVYNSYYENDDRISNGWGHGFCYANMFPFWDSILSTGRRCFGFSVIDWFGEGKWDDNGDGEKEVHDYGSHMLLVPNLDEHECLKAYRDGAFYGVIKDTGLRFTAIVAKANNPTVTACVNKNAELRVYTSRGLVKSTVGGNISYTANETDIFVRIEATDTADTDGLIFSNPIMLDESDFNNSDDDFIKSQKRKRRLLLCSGY